MEQKTKRLLFNIGYWIMIVAVITACFSVVKFMKSEGRECLADPPKYYEEKTGTPCSCGGIDFNLANGQISFPINFTIDE